MTTNRDNRYVRIDPDVFAFIRKNAKAGESPNTVIRRLFGMPEVEQGRRSATLKPFKRKP